MSYTVQRTYNRDAWLNPNNANILKEEQIRPNIQVPIKELLVFPGEPNKEDRKAGDGLVTLRDPVAALNFDWQYKLSLTKYIRTNKILNSNMLTVGQKSYV